MGEISTYVEFVVKRRGTARTALRRSIGFGIRSVLQLAKYLSFLSTSAPAPCSRVDPTASRRGTCDRRICTKPLARRTRGSYGFCMRESRVVRWRDGLGGRGEG